MDLKKKILLTGGSGFIGTKLSQRLLKSGYIVHVVDLVEPRIKDPDLFFTKLNLFKDRLPDSMDGELHSIIHLAGKNIFGRWTKKFMDGVYRSRIESTKRIVETVSDWKQKPSSFISASAFGYYGNKIEKRLDESADAGTDFLSKVCKDWEDESKKLNEYGVRTVQIRTSHVVGRGGLLAPLFVPFKFGLGAWIGTGKAWFPWVHIDDICAIYQFAVETEALSGPVNTAAPEVVRQKEFMKQFGDSQNRRVLFSLPIWLLRLRYGKLAETFNNSARISSKKLLDAGFTFRFPELKQSLDAVV